MARRIGALRPLALSLLAGAVLAALAGSAEAQGNGRKSGHYKEKRVERELRREDRGPWRDGRIALPRDRRERNDDRFGRLDDRRTRDRRPVLLGRSVGPSRVPPGQLPPPGLCRIWIDGVPPGRQPRPTDCATAQRYRPANARVLYGGAARGGRYDDRYDRYDDRYDGRYGRRRDDDRYERRRDDDRYERRSDERRSDERRSDDRSRAPGGYVDPRSLPRIRLPFP